MILYPAIDLKDGKCVRLRQGDMQQATVFNDDPSAQARAFADAGFEWLHVVDLDGAFSGRAANEKAIRAILSSVSIPVQLGGGIRNHATIKRWLDAGVARVILGTAAVRDPALVKEAARANEGCIAVGIDARAGRVAMEGWGTVSDRAAADVARAYEDDGVAAIIFTDIARDGMMGGANVEATAALARAVSIPVIASGGVSSVADIEALKKTNVVAGAVIGRALYDGAIDARAAIMASRSEAIGQQKPRET